MTETWWAGFHRTSPFPIHHQPNQLHRRHPSIHRQRLHLPPAGKCNHHGHPQTTSVTVPTPRRAPNAAPRGGGELCPRSHRCPRVRRERAQGGGVGKQYFQGWWSMVAGGGWRKLASGSCLRGDRSCLPECRRRGGTLRSQMDTTTTQRRIGRWKATSKGGIVDTTTNNTTTQTTLDHGSPHRGRQQHLTSDHAEHAVQGCDDPVRIRSPRHAAQRRRPDGNGVTARYCGPN
eukprot:185073_1